MNLHLFSHTPNKSSSKALFHSITSPLYLFLISLFTLLLCTLTIAAPKNNSETELLTTLRSELPQLEKSLMEVENHIAFLKDLGALNNQQKIDSASYSQARELLQKSIESINHTISYIQASQNAPQQLTIIEQELDTPIPDENFQINTALPLAKLESLLEQKRKELDAARQSRAHAENEIARRNDRQSKLYDESIVTRNQLEKIQYAQTKPADSTAEPSNDAKNHELSAKLAYLKYLSIELDQEDHSYDSQRMLLRAERQLAERRTLVAEKHFNALYQIINELRNEAAAQVKLTAENASLAAASAHPAIRNIIEENKILAEELAKISLSRTSLSQQKKKLDETVNETRRNFDSIREKIAQIGLTDAIGLKLRKDRKLLPDSDIYLRNLKARNSEISRLQLRRIEIEDQLLELIDINQEALRIMDALDESVSENERDSLLIAIQQALRTQKEDYYNELIKAYDSYFDKELYPIIEQEQSLIALIKNYKEFIDTHVLWIQSAPIIELSDLQRLATATAWFVNPFSWVAVANALGKDLLQHPLIIITPLLLIIILLVSQRYLKVKLSILGRFVTKLSKAKFTDTLVVALLTLLMSIPWPLLIYLISWRIDQLEDATSFANAVASGLKAVAFLLFSCILLRHFCRKEGLGELHFRWKSENLNLIRRQLNWYLPFALPLLFIFVMTMNQPAHAHHDSLGRVAFITLMGITVLLVRRLLHPNQGLLKLYIEKNPAGWFSRLSGIWYPTLLITPIGLAIAAIFGYLYTSGQLFLYIIDTVLLIFAVIVTRAFLIRWLNIEQRKLTIEQWRKKFAAQGETGESGELNINEEPELDVETISTQTTRLLNSAFWIAIIIGITLIWTQILPAFNALNDVVLWNTEVTNLESGAETSSLVPITLANLVLAIIILLMTFFISQNIPGLLEIAILQRLPFTPSGRYAITSITRYILIIVGLAMTFSIIGIGWSKVQWLAAAITVGLGFGLQEIFANFVSGLIILFERPIRLGDVVTIGNISGKVSRIQMRATTITDWDRKELIIPNKEFITGQVVNWSLSDSILRIVIPVGIAYGSDTRLAHDILLSIAKAHPNVLKDPEPNARFIAFGDSTLNFELRVFIPDPDLLLTTRHDILTEIDHNFREAKIEIAFPQQDIHIKSFDSSLLPKT